MSEPRRRALGRGLGALITSTETPSAGDDPGAAGAPPVEQNVRLIPVVAIQPNPRQPRTRFDDAALDELAASIRTHGVIQPLVLTANPRRPDLYWLVAGERRWRAAQRAGLHAVPALVRDADDRQLVELALIENLQRADLDALEEARAYATLLEEFGLTQAEVAERVGKSRSAVANTVRLLNLPDALQAALADGLLSPGHARALLPLPNEATMLFALEQIRGRDLTVRETEALVKRLLAQAAQPLATRTESSPAVLAQVAHMEERFRLALGTRVALNRNDDGSGRLVIHFYSDADLEALYRSVAGDDDAELPLAPADFPL